NQINKMVCEKCEKKLGKVITPDPWKSGARNTTEGGGRKLNENKALTQGKNRFSPYSSGQFVKCRVCKSLVHQIGAKFCQGCAYKKGICAMCGRKMINTTNYRQSAS
uniref:Cysteine-rich PDZ-binding protein n=1 Tax=Ciona savignyi TaxID=51511 RepID=H2YPP9_CIOSA